MQETLSRFESEIALLETLIHNAPIGFAFVDRDLRYVRINKILADEHVLSVEDHIGKSVKELLPHLWPRIESYYRRALEGEVVIDNDFRDITNSGDMAYWMLSYYPVRVGDEVVGVGLMVNKFTERRRTEDQLKVRTHLYAMLSASGRAVSRCRSREELFREVCEIAVDTGNFQCACILVPTGNRVEVAALAGEHNGYLDKLVIVMDDADPRSDGPAARCIKSNQAVIVNNFTTSTMTAPWRDIGLQSGFGASAAFPLMERGRVVAVLSLYAARPDFFTDDLVSTLREIVPCLSSALDGFLLEADRNRAQEELRRRDTAILEERNRLAREIHDALAQGLTGIVMELQAAASKGPGDPGNPESPIALARKLAQECLEEARRSVAALRPVVLESDGLEEALRNTVEQLSRGSLAKCSFELVGKARRLSREVEDNLLRMGQEALANALQHSRADRINVILTCEARTMSVSVRDNGIGIDTKLPSIGGYGLIRIKDRADRIHGSFVLASQPGEGTTVTISVPI